MKWHGLGFKDTPTPWRYMVNITIPKKLDPIVQAFFAESPKAAKKLVIQAVKAIYGSDEEYLFQFPMKRQHTITDEDIEDICAFMQGVKPNDMFEAIIAAQIIVTHMLGMRKLATGYIADQHLGMKMLRFSTDAMQQVQKKRRGGMQTITVNYNYNGTQPTAPTIPIEICD